MHKRKHKKRPSPTDIMLFTRNRLDYLKRTLEEGIFPRTRTPYALHIIDDASTEGNVEYLLDLWHTGKISSLLLRRDRAGLRANHNVGFWMTFSDPVVFTDDDALPPDVQPDWLTRLLRAMAKRPQLGILALNNPGANPWRGGKGARKLYASDGEVTYSRIVGGIFMAVRRPILQNWTPPHARGLPINMSRTKTRPGGGPSTLRCARAAALGYKVGYLTGTYCHHFGEKCARSDMPICEVKIMKPINAATLEPPKKWAW